jgi:sulfite reductase alpha subunit-like flavoprotein
MRRKNRDDAEKRRFCCTSARPRWLRSARSSQRINRAPGDQYVGDGEPPDDGIVFFDYVKDLGEASLHKLRFAVFALGDTSYDNFCQCGRDLDRMFEERGASRLLARVDNDVDFEEALGSWREAVVMAIQDAVTV